MAQVFSSQFCEIFKNTIFTSLLLIKTPRFLHILDIQEISSPPYYQDPPIYLALKSMEQWEVRSESIENLHHQRDQNGS